MEPSLSDVNEQILRLLVTSSSPNYRAPRFHFSKDLRRLHIEHARYGSLNEVTPL